MGAICQWPAWVKPRLEEPCSREGQKKRLEFSQRPTLAGRAWAHEKTRFITAGSCQHYLVGVRLIKLLSVGRTINFCAASSRPVEQRERERELARESRLLLRGSTWEIRLLDMAMALIISQVFWEVVKTQFFRSQRKLVNVRRPLAQVFNF